MESNTSSRNKRVYFRRNSATIISAMEYLTRNVTTNESLEEIHGAIDQKPCQASAYLEERLHISHQQTLLLTCMMYVCAKTTQGCATDVLIILMDIHPLRIMELEGELERLADLGFVYKDNRRWRISPEARKALLANDDFSLEKIRKQNNIDFLVECDRIIKRGGYFDEDGTIRRDIERQLKINAHLSFVARLGKLGLEDDDRWTLLISAIIIGGDGDEYVVKTDLERVLSPLEARRKESSIRECRNILVKRGLVEPFNDGGFAKTDGWVLTRQAWTELLANEEEIKAAMQDIGPTSEITLAADLKPRRLFFEHDLQQQVDRLEELLSEERFGHVRDMLAKKGLPMGFCCLFYGTPGTGKTELVQQLAIRTGRDLMQVDIAQLRDKFVGESEKHIKAVFDHYRLICARSKKAPILFFNEADAIFGNRMENTARAVDKMENALQNIILQEMEKLEGIMICTTNLTSTLDKAFERRFLYKIEFCRPSAEARKHIWQNLVSGLTDEQAGELAERFDFSGGQIQNISRKQIIQQVFSGTDALNYEQLLLDCNAERLSRTNGRKIGF